ncbi:MAG: hypothetical protein Q4G33_06405 [bacterium]|nr:hypothetical protein [bacterium]
MQKIIKEIYAPFKPVKQMGMATHIKASIVFFDGERETYSKEPVPNGYYLIMTLGVLKNDKNQFSIEDMLGCPKNPKPLFLTEKQSEWGEHIAKSRYSEKAYKTINVPGWARFARYVNGDVYKHLRINNKLACNTEIHTTETK